MKKWLYIVFVVMSFALNAQAPSKWYNKFGGFGVDIGYGVKEGYHRQYIVCGSTTSFGNGASDAYLVLVDSMGQLKWQKTFGGVLADIAKSVVVNPIDSGFIFTGYTSSFGNGGYDVYVVRTDKIGNLIWQKSFGGLDWDFGNDIILAPDGNLMICGYTYNSKYGKKDGYILKVNSTDGALMWEKYYGGSEDDDLRSVALMSDATYVLTGETGSYNDVKGDIYFLKTNLNGDSIVSKTLGLKDKEDFGNTIFEGILGGYIIGGGTESYSSWGKDAFICKVSSVGDSLWLQHYGNANVDQAACKVLPTNNLQAAYVISYSDVLSPFKRNPKNLLVTGIGIYITGSDFGDFEDEELSDLANTTDRGFIGVGYTQSWGSVSQDLFIVKYDSTAYCNGNLIGVKENAVLQENKIHIFPTLLSNDNPLLRIESNNLFKYSVSDIYSKEIIAPVLSKSSNIEIDFKNLSVGIYFIKIESEGKITCVKILRKD